jgi:hypothetical protein
MVSWTVTATTIYCEKIKSEVTVLVYKDGSVKCTGFQAIGNAKAPCADTNCSQIRQYRDKLFAEEAANQPDTGSAK